jgi:Response regulator containing CheY-like receiver domain and AraC-type DNA-binding domain
MYKLLICDDEPIERIALRKIIERKYSNIAIVDDAVTGLDAIAKVKLYMPDILLMDIKMPEMNGINAQQQIIQIHPEIKTVIITAYCDFLFAQEAIRYNVVEFLLKPLPPKNLYECLQRILDSKAVQSSEPHNHTSVIDTDANNSIKHALAYIDENYLLDLHLADVAANVHLSDKYFSRLFREQTGLTFTDYINKRRIDRAKSYLLHTTASIYQIAMNLNYSDSSYFTKVFYRYEQVTPMQFRKKKGL